jgi:hypothetical protein
MQSDFELQRQAESYLERNPEELQKIALMLEPDSTKYEAPFPDEQHAPPREPGDDFEESPEFSRSERIKPESVPWPTLQSDALHGLAGKIVSTIEPHSEADPAALLAHLMVAFGNVIGRGPHFLVGSARHSLNLFSVMVGLTSKGRKGTSSSELKPLFKNVELYWFKNRQLAGLSTGEGLIFAVRDPIHEMKAVKEKKQIVKYEEVLADPGVEDKRLFILETEFGRVLSVMSRDGSTLSAVLRQAWDGDDLQVLTKNSAARSTEPHISIVGHITQQEILKLFTATDSHNGLGNRFLWVCVKRSQYLPDGGNLQPRELEPLTKRLFEVTEDAKYVSELKRDVAAGAFWHEIYRPLSEGQPGLFGAVTSRAEAQTMRLACLYALLDGKAVVGLEHLKAAYALWRYCEDSARFIFGSGTGNVTADKILAALRKSPLGLTRTDIAVVLNRNVDAAQTQTALDLLSDLKLARRVSENRNGSRKPTERWVCVE